MSKVKRVKDDLRKLAPKELRKIRDWLEDFLEDQLEFTQEFEEVTRRAKSKTKSTVRPRKNHSTALGRKLRQKI